MADVVVSLSLKRKSGILAAAISTLARAGLEFQTHRFADAKGDEAIRLELLASGDLDNAGELAEDLSKIRGVSAVIDIGADGQSLLGSDQAPSGEVLDATGVAGLMDAFQSAPTSAHDSRAEASSRQEPAPEAVPDSNIQPEPGSEPAPDAVSGSELDLGQFAEPEPESASEPEPELDLSEFVEPEPEPEPEPEFDLSQLSDIEPERKKKAKSGPQPDSGSETETPTDPTRTYMARRRRRRR